MADKRTNPRKERRRLADLVDHPLQSAYSGTTTDQDDEGLQKSIEESGLKDPLDVLPKNKAELPVNTIMDGHRRRDVLVSLGVETVAVIVRYDLAKVSRAAIDREFLKANMDRRQLDPLARAYLAARLVEIERKLPFDERPDDYQYDDVRERVGKMLGISGRHLSRLLRVIQTPIEVQTAVRRKKLSIVLAEKVADLPEDIQAKTAERIGAGEDAKRVVECYVSNGRGKPFYSSTEYSRYMRSLKNLLERFSDSADDIGFTPWPGDIETLEAGRELHRKLIRQLRRNANGNAKSRNRAVSALTKKVNQTYAKEATIQGHLGHA